MMMYSVELCIKRSVESLSLIGMSVKKCKIEIKIKIKNVKCIKINKYLYTCICMYIHVYKKTVKNI